MPWIKGQSGNPRGRPVTTGALRKVLACNKATDVLAPRLLRLALDQAVEKYPVEFLKLYERVCNKGGDTMVANLAHELSVSNDEDVDTP
ncbi:hypothetical protein LCGC14_0898350 [marine sediment metagenome]|uniref:DUF5681 domain-containing protein n=1 Tax=marine sediment metagenome TaxID=412755 RepID=A0A0F9S406_9ZZZZ